MAQNEWQQAVSTGSYLKDINAGDEVMLNGGDCWVTDYKVVTVDRVTKTLIIVNGVKYNRSHGERTIRCSHTPQWLYPVNMDKVNQAVTVDMGGM